MLTGHRLNRVETAWECLSTAQCSKTTHTYLQFIQFSDFTISSIILDKIYTCNPLLVHDSTSRLSIAIVGNGQLYL